MLAFICQTHAGLTLADSNVPLFTEVVYDLYQPGVTTSQSVTAGELVIIEEATVEQLSCNISNNENLRQQLQGKILIVPLRFYYDFATKCYDSVPDDMILLVPPYYLCSLQPLAVIQEKPLKERRLAHFTNNDIYPEFASTNPLFEDCMSLRTSLAKSKVSSSNLTGLTAHLQIDQDVWNDFFQTLPPALFFRVLLASAFLYVCALSIWSLQQRYQRRKLNLLHVLILGADFVLSTLLCAAHITGPYQLFGWNSSLHLKFQVRPFQLLHDRAKRSRPCIRDMVVMDMAPHKQEWISFPQCYTVMPSRK